MSILASALDTRGAEYTARREAMLARLAELDAEHAKALAGGGPKYTQRHRARGKLLARERIELLIDPDSPFPHARGALMRTPRELRVVFG